MEIKTNRLLLREITWGDLEEIHRLQLVPEVDEFNTVGLPKDINETEVNIAPFIDNKTDKIQSRYTWKIILHDTNEFIGLTGIHLSNDKFRIGEIFYKLHPHFWGNGYATEVTRKLIEIGFKEFYLHKIEAGTAVKNYKSIHVLEKVGMIREGIRRKILPIRGEWVDSYHYSINEDDELK